MCRRGRWWPSRCARGRCRAWRAGGRRTPAPRVSGLRSIRRCSRDLDQVQDAGVDDGVGIWAVTPWRSMADMGGSVARAGASIGEGAARAGRRARRVRAPADGNARRSPLVAQALSERHPRQAGEGVQAQRTCGATNSASSDQRHPGQQQGEAAPAQQQRACMRRIPLRGSRRPSA